MGTSNIAIDEGTADKYVATYDISEDAATKQIQRVGLNSSTGVELAKAEDAAHTSGDFGLMALAVRTDTATARAGTDGDYIPLITDSSGRLHVNNSGVTQPVSVAAGAATIGKAEDVASADADVGVPAMAVRKATPANVSGTDGDYEFLQISAGRLWTNSLLGDGTNAVAVKAASTAPAATDPALVVSISPNSVNANGQATMANSAPVTIASNQSALTTGGITVTKDVTLSLDTAAYASGDVLADTQQVDAALRVADGTGVLQSLMVIDEDDQKVTFTVYFLSANVSMGTENAAPSISDANAANILGFVEVSGAEYKDLGGVAVANIKNIGIPLKAVSGTDDIYVAVVNGTGAPTYTASGVKLRLGILQD